MLRILGRVAVVCIGLFALLAASAWQLTRDEWPAVRLELKIAGRDADGRNVSWQFRICEVGSMFLGNRQLGHLGSGRETDEAARRRRLATLEEFFAEYSKLKPPLTVFGRNREIEDEWTFAIDEQGRASLGGNRAKVEDVRARLERFVKAQQTVPTARLAMAISGRTSDGKGIDLEFTIGEAGQATLQGQPFSVDELLTAVDPLWTVIIGRDGTVALNERPSSAEEIDGRLKQFRRFQEIAPQVSLLMTSSLDWSGASVEGGDQEEARVFIDGATSSLKGLADRLAQPAGSTVVTCRPTVKRLKLKVKTHDPGWTFTVPETGPSMLDGKPFDEAQFKEKLRTFVADEQIERTRPVTVQDVLDYYKAHDIPLFTIREVDLPGFPYSKVRAAFPEFPAEPKVVIKQYHGHPMHDNRDLMPEEMKEHYPETLPPVEERLPLVPAVTYGCDGIGKYSKKERPMVWRRASGDAADALGRKIGYPSMVRFDPGGRIQPNMAWRWEITDNNRVYTFYLRPGHKWSDGEPFTTEDLLFLFDTVIGSPAWSQTPNWMQETDGSSMLYADDVTDWAALAARISREAASPEPSPGRQLVRVIDEDQTGKLAFLKEALLGITPEALPDDLAKSKIVMALNSLFGRKEFYDKEAFAQVDVVSEMEEFRRRGLSRLSKEDMERYNILMLREDWLRRIDKENVDEWKPGELTQLNLLMFRVAYRPLVAPAKRERVKVDAVDDGTGDTSHIIRFTFKKPNSIFLEKLATFMAYRGMFGSAKHFLRWYHADGMRELTRLDILDWPGLVKHLQQAAAPSPGQRVWSLLSDKVKDRLSKSAPSNSYEVDVEYKDAVVVDLNRVMRLREFYDAAAWAEVDFDHELSELLKDGYTQYLKRLRERRRINKLLARADMLERGAADLSEDELFDFNIMVFRAALDGTPKKGSDQASDKFVASHRDEALDLLANFRSSSFRTWGDLWQQTGKYNNDWNRHRPTLCPWRVVTEPEETTIIAVRNPFYFRVDAEGNQLPYLDMIKSEIVGRKQIRQLKIMSGSVDFQSRNLEFEDFTPLKQKEKDGDYEVRLWANDFCGELTFTFDQGHQDGEYAKILSDPRFHHAMSLALDRQVIIDVVWQGMGTPAQFSVPEGSPYYSAKHHRMSIEYDPEGANRLLDEMGLQKRNREGVRLMPGSGRPVYVEVSTEEERPLNAVQMACNYWRAVGVNARMKIRRGIGKYDLINMGVYDIWAHKEGGNYFGPIDGGSYAPTHPAESVQYPRWAAWLRSGGREGKEPPDRVKEIDYLWTKVLTAPSEQAKIKAWLELSDRTADELPVLAVMTSPGKVLVVRNNFKNVPKIALAGWMAHEPGNCNPSVFYIEQDD